MSNVTILEDGTFERCLGYDSGTLTNGMSALIKHTPESSLARSAMWGYSEKTSASEEAGPFQTPNLPVP